MAMQYCIFKKKQEMMRGRRDRAPVFWIDGMLINLL